MVTPFAVSTPTPFAAILFISSKEFSHEIKKQVRISNKKIWRLRTFIYKILNEGKTLKMLQKQ
jgi:hypothetical protein